MQRGARLTRKTLLYIETDHGMVVVELAPEFAPIHVARMTHARTPGALL